MATGAAEFGVGWWARAKRAALLGMIHLGARPWFQRVLIAVFTVIMAAVALVIAAILLPLLVLGVLAAVVLSGASALVRGHGGGTRDEAEGRENVRVIRRDEV